MMDILVSQIGRLLTKPDTLVNSTSEIDPTYRGSTKHTHPLGGATNQILASVVMLVFTPC